MDRQKKQFIGICVLLLICVAAYFGLRTYNEKTAEKEQQEEESKQMEAVAIDAETVKSFSYQVNGNTLTFEKQGDTWYYQPDHSININQDTITTMLAAVASVTSEEKMENVEDISEYGFNSPMNILTFEMEDGTRTITLGMQNEITGQYYIMDNNTSAIYIVDTDLNSSFSGTVEDMTVVEETESVEESDMTGESNATGESDNTEE